MFAEKDTLPLILIFLIILGILSLCFFSPKKINSKQENYRQTEYSCNTEQTKPAMTTKSKTEQKFQSVDDKLDYLCSRIEELFNEKNPDMDEINILMLEIYQLNITTAEQDEKIARTLIRAMDKAAKQQNIDPDVARQAREIANNLKSIYTETDPDKIVTTMDKLPENISPEIRELQQADFTTRLDFTYKKIIDVCDSSEVLFTSEQVNEEIIPAAEASNPKAETILGMLYSYGYLIEQNGEKAVYWLERAVEHGVETMRKQLSNLYYKGSIVPQDIQKVIEWNLPLAEKGNALSQTFIGNIYAAGIGNVARDYKKAHKWLKLAAAQNIPEAQMGLGYIYLNGWEVEKDYLKARKFFLQAASQGDYYGAYLGLGIIYDKGLGVTQNTNKAIAYYQKAVDLGDFSFMERLQELKSATTVREATKYLGGSYKSYQKPADDLQAECKEQLRKLEAATTE